LLVRDVHLFFLAVDPRWDAMREDPRFQSLIERGRFCGRNAVLREGRCQVTEAGAAASPPEETPAGYEPGQTSIASANIDGIWTMKASMRGGAGTASGLVEFSGPAGKTRQMGMCIVRRHQSDTGSVPCDTVDDCASAPAVLPEGGRRYCLAPASRGAKFCHYRPGQPEQNCAGSPALDFARIPPGAYRVDRAAAPGSQWLTLACFNVCVALPPAISESATVR
jgi:hypothetical protein